MEIISHHVFGWNSAMKAAPRMKEVGAFAKISKEGVIPWIGRKQNLVKTQKEIERKRTFTMNSN